VLRLTAFDNWVRVAFYYVEHRSEALYLRGVDVQVFTPGGYRVLKYVNITKDVSHYFEGVDLCLSVAILLQLRLFRYIAP
jgi:hypothetical protein